MAWMTQLYKTYDNLAKNAELLQNCKMPLLPMSHTVQNAHVEMVIDMDGNLHRVYETRKENALTIVPCTVDSEARSSNVAPHMLHDNLKNLAGDTSKYGYKSKGEYEKYKEQLGEDKCVLSKKAKEKK